MRAVLTYLAFLILVAGGGGLGGVLFMPDSWYASLAKPPFNPPNWIFGPVWSTLYLMIALAGARMWQRGPNDPAMRTWWLQWVANIAWTPVFFGMHALAPALAIILALLAFIAWFIRQAWPRDRVAALLFVPYLFWVAFASLLNASLLALNGAP